MMDWDAIIPKLLLILKDRTTEIRRDISPERIVEATTAAIAASGLDFKSSPETILKFHEFNEVKLILDNINDEHRERIRVFLGSLGEVLGDSGTLGDSFLGEDDTHVFVSFERMKLKLEKDLALKIVSLGYAPAG